MVEQPPRVVYRGLKSPVTAQMELTARCNNLCLYCYNSFRGDKEQLVKCWNSIRSRKFPESFFESLKENLTYENANS